MSVDEDYKKEMARILIEMGEEPYREYWKELGKFIHTFSQTERHMMELLRKLAGTSNPIAGIVFSGTRTEVAKDFINRILDVTGASKTKARLSRAFAQLGEISGVRNRLVHWEVRDDGNPALRVSNASQYPHPDRLQEYRLTADDLKAMSADLIKIGFFFTLESHPPSEPTTVWDAYLAEPWLYKLPPQAPPGTRSRRRARAQSRRRAASEE